MAHLVVTDLTGRTHKWTIDGYTPPGEETRPRSELHKKARALLYELYPNTMILEEVVLPGTRLSVDFFLPSIRLAVEVQGEQHSKFVPHFHVTMLGFIKQKQRDKEKSEWLSLNNIQLIQLNYTEDINEWKSKLNGR